MDQETRSQQHVPPRGALTHWPALIVVGSLLFAIGLIVFRPLALVGLLLILVPIPFWIRQAGRMEWGRHPTGGDDIITRDWWWEPAKSVYAAFAFMFTFSWFFAAAFRAAVPLGLLDPSAVPPVARDLNTPLVTGATLLLVVSGGTAYWATRGLRDAAASAIPVALAATFTLGLLFLILQGVEAVRLVGAGFSPGSSPAGSIFYWLLALHSLLVLGSLVMLAVVAGRARRGHFTEGRGGTVWGAAIFWWYAIAVWLLIYALVYLRWVTYEQRIL